LGFRIPLRLIPVARAVYDQVVKSGQIKDRATADLAKHIAETEQAHVDALHGTVMKLGGKPAAKPATKFDDVLAAGPAKILQTAATVENLGAAAYLGQAGRIKSKEILAAALAIHSVEARHAAALNSSSAAASRAARPRGLDPRRRVRQGDDHGPGAGPGQAVPRLLTPRPQGDHDHGQDPA
jgi:rubrerythrin